MTTAKPVKGGKTCFLTLKATIEARQHIHDSLALLSPVLGDCVEQYEALTHRQDVVWDCYEPYNWEVMVDSLKRIQKELKQLNSKLTGAKLQYNGIKKRK